MSRGICLGVLFLLLCKGRGSRFGQVLRDVLSDWDLQPFQASKIQGSDNPTWCLLLAVGVEQDLIKEMVDIGRQVVTLGDEGQFAPEAAARLLDTSAWCLYAVVQLQERNHSDITHVIRLTEAVHNRRSVYLTMSASGTSQLSTELMDSPALIIEASLEHFFIHSVCHNCHFTLIQRTNLWKANQGLVLPNKNPQAQCCFGRTELYGKTFNVSFFGATPYVALDYNRNPPIYGIDFEVLMLLARKFRFKPNIVGEKTWGVLVNGTWFGTVGSVQRRTSLMGFGHIGIQHDRFQAIDFSVSTYLVEYSYFANLPRRLPPFKNVVAPFTNLVWATVAGVVGTVAFSFALVFYVRSAHPSIFAIPNVSLTSRLDLLLLPLGMMVTQSRVGWFERHPRYTAGSILVLVWSLGGAFLAHFYMSTLRASLIAVEHEKPPDTLQAVLDSGENVYHPKRSSVTANLRHSPAKVLRDLYHRVAERGTYYSYTGNMPEVEFDEMERTKTGYLIASRDGYRLEKQRLQRRYGYVPFRFVKENVVTVYAGVAVPKHCLFVDHINLALTGLIEFGVMQHLFVGDVPARFLVEQSSDAAKISAEQQPLGISTVLSSGMFWASMCVVASITFWCEGRRTPNKERRDSEGTSCQLQVTHLRMMDPEGFTSSMSRVET